VASLDGFVTPAMQQPEHGLRVGHELLQRIALDPRNDPADQPTRQAEFNNGNQRSMLIQGDEGSSEVILWLRHGPISIVLGFQRRWCHLASPPAP
jgi:hypothetical protein